MNRPQIGIIGYGDFSRLMVKHLTSVADVVVSSRRKVEDKTVRAVNEEEVLSQPIIVPSMPAQFLEEYFTTHKKLLNPHALIVDVCSVKVTPARVLPKVLPKTTDILLTHPMFGPASVTNGLKDQRIMLHPLRISPKKYAQIKLFLKNNFGLHIIETTPKEHDRAMAYVQGLSHYIGRVMDIMQIPKTELITRAYADLLDMKRIQGGDSWELFESIMHENPYSRKVHEQLLESFEQLDKQLGFKK